MSANIEQIKAMLERTGKTNLLQKQKVDLDKEQLQLEATVNREKIDKSPEVDLEKFTEKVKTFQERYKHPESTSIKGAMAFMARMFYQYPNVARLWYDSLPKATMD